MEIKKISKEQVLIAQSAQQSAEHYNLMIWNVFSIGVALSLWIVYNMWTHKVNTGPMWFVIPFFGLLVLFYCTLAIESFGQKRDLMYCIFNECIKRDTLEHKINSLPFYRINWLAEGVMFTVFVIYIFFFGYILINNSLKTYGGDITFLAFPIFFFSLFLLFIVLLNWVRRKPAEKGNLLEIIRIRLLESIRI